MSNETANTMSKDMNTVTTLSNETVTSMSKDTASTTMSKDMDTFSTLSNETSNTMPRDTATSMSKDTPTTMSKDTLTKVQEYKDSLIQRTELLVTKRFPEIIVELNELLTTPMFKERDMEKLHQDISIPMLPRKLKKKHDYSDDQPKRKHRKSLPKSYVSCNKSICEMINVVKPIIRALIVHANLLKMWISFMIPKIEDGNNFGVAVQKGTLAQIEGVGSYGDSYFVHITAYFRARAKIVSRLIKNPHIEDYRKALNDLDEQEGLNMWIMVTEIRNRYSSLHDLVIKNLEKIKTPRNYNTESLY